VGRPAAAWLQGRRAEVCGAAADRQPAARRVTRCQRGGGGAGGGRGRRARHALPRRRSGCDVDCRRGACCAAPATTCTPGGGGGGNAAGRRSRSRGAATGAGAAVAPVWVHTTGSGARAAVTGANGSAGMHPGGCTHTQPQTKARRQKALPPGKAEAHHGVAS
jgi:hypothetical protein